MEELWEHEYCYICEQCDNGYESREELEDHRRRRHIKYNCDQCDNWYESREYLEDHRRRRHSQECEEENSNEDKESEVEIEEIQEVVEELEKISTIEKQNINKSMSEVIRDKNTINREDIEDLEKYIEEQVVDIIVRQKIKETIESLNDVIDDLGKNTTQMQTIKNMVEVLYSTFEKSEEELEETSGSINRAGRKQNNRAR